MKKSILTILVAVTFSALFSGNLMAQAKTSPKKAKPAIEQPKPDSSATLSGQISPEEKEGCLNIMNAAKTTILKSANSNTTEQNVNLINELQKVMTLFNERFQKIVAAEVKDKPKK